MKALYFIVTAAAAIFAGCRCGKDIASASKAVQPYGSVATGISLKGEKVSSLQAAASIACASSRITRVEQRLK